MQMNFMTAFCIHVYVYYTGILSKSHGQVLKVAAVLQHILFSIEKESVPHEVSDAALQAAVDFVCVSCQQTAYVAGRGPIDKEIEQLNQSGIINETIV